MVTPPSFLMSCPGNDHPHHSAGISQKCPADTRGGGGFKVILVSIRDTLRTSAGRIVEESSEARRQTRTGKKDRRHERTTRVTSTAVQDEEESQKPEGKSEKTTGSGQTGRRTRRDETQNDTTQKRTESQTSVHLNHACTSLRLRKSRDRKHVARRWAAIREAGQTQAQLLLKGSRTHRAT